MKRGHVEEAQEGQPEAKVQKAEGAGATHKFGLLSGAFGNKGLKQTLEGVSRQHSPPQREVLSNNS